MLDETVAIETPEGVEMKVVPAGLGSRSEAAAADTIIFGAIILALMLLLEAFIDVFSGGFALAIIIGSLSLGYCAYFVFFDMVMNGRSPGKRSSGIRVIKDNGESVDFMSSAIRNIMRLVDFLPVGYGIGIVSVFASTKCQRLGDYAAGTLVVHDNTPRKLSRRKRKKAEKLKYVPRFGTEDVVGWDVTGITNEELSIVRSYLARRAELLPSARRDLEQKLASALRGKVVGPDVQSLPDDELLEKIDTAKASQT